MRNIRHLHLGLCASVMTLCIVPGASLAQPPELGGDEALTLQHDLEALARDIGLEASKTQRREARKSEREQRLATREASREARKAEKKNDDE